MPSDDYEEEVMAWVNALANDPSAGHARGIAIIAAAYKDHCDSQKMMIESMLNTLTVIRDMTAAIMVSLERVTEDRDRVRSIAHEMARLMKCHGLDFYEVCHRFEKEYHNEPA